MLKNNQSNDEGTLNDVSGKLEQQSILSKTPLVPYSNPAGDEYPVIAYNNVQLVVEENGKSLKEATRREIYDFMTTVKDCGFNVNMWVSGNTLFENLIEEYLKVTKVIGIPSILNLSGWTPVKQDYDNEDKDKKNPIYKPTIQNLIDVLGSYWQHTNLWGYMLADEPFYNGWGLKNEIDIPEGTANFGMSYKAYETNHHDKHAFVVLPASLDTKYTTGKDPKDSEQTEDEEKDSVDKDYKSQYKDYLSNICDGLSDNSRMEMLAVDIYPIIKEGGIDPATIKIEYFYSLEAIGEFSRENNIPFWLFLQSNYSVDYDANGNIEHTGVSPTVGTLRYQAMNAIAHGIQGLVFWTYGISFFNWHKKVVDPIEGTTEKTYVNEACFNAPYVNYRKTKLWYNCQTVIPEIKKYGKILLGAKFQAARHVYGPSERDRYECTTELESSVPFGCISSATASGKGLVITLLKKDNTNYMAIVSHDWEKSQSITINFLENSTPSFVNEKGSYGIIGKSINQRIRPGDMILIKY